MVVTQTLQRPCLKGYFVAWRSLELGAQRWKVSAWCPNDRETSERRKPRTIYCSGLGPLALCCCRDEKEMSQKKKFEVKRVNQNVICRPSSQSTGTREQGNKGKHDDQTNETLISVTARNFQKHICGEKNKNKQKKTLTLDTIFFFPRRIFHNFRTMQNDWTADTIRQRRDDSVYSPQCFEISRTRPAELRGRCRLTSLPTGEFTLSHQAAGTKAKAGGDEKKKGGQTSIKNSRTAKWTRPSRPTLLKCLGCCRYKVLCVLSVCLWGQTSTDFKPYICVCVFVCTRVLLGWLNTVR